MPFTYFTLALRAGICVLMACATQETGRTSPLAVEFAKGAATYDIPGARGLKSFHCDVVLDWKTFLSALQDGPVSDGSEGLSYLRHTSLAIDDDLLTGGNLNWSNMTPVPNGESYGSAKLKRAMEDMFSVFYSLWNKFATGDMVTLTDDKTSIERWGMGYRLSIAQDESLVEETYDDKFLLQRFHTRSSSGDFEINPTFWNGPDGRLSSSIKTVTKSERMKEVEFATYLLKYQRVQMFELPSEVKIKLTGAPEFTFGFNNCSVRTQEPKNAQAKNMRR